MEAPFAGFVIVVFQCARWIAKWSKLPSGFV